MFPNITIKASDIAGKWDYDQDFTQQTMYAKETRKNENLFVKNAFTFPWRFIADTDRKKTDRKGETTLQEAQNLIGLYEANVNIKMTYAVKNEIKNINSKITEVSGKISQYKKLTAELNAIDKKKTPTAYTALKEKLAAIAPNLQTLVAAKIAFLSQITQVNTYFANNFKVDGQLTEAEARIAAVDIENSPPAQEVVEARGGDNNNSSLAHNVSRE